MKLPLSWLRDWVDTDAAPAAIADALTRRGFYVEGIETRGGDFPGIVVARVLEVAKHPKADRLSLCRVDSGAGEVRVVCGAPNVVAGMIAPLATVGTTMPDGRTIETAKIRGETSMGMLCSARELMLSEEHEGILDLRTLADGRAERSVGRPLAELLGPPEAVLEVEIPFNRPDGLGIVGLAREVKAAFAARWSERALARFGAAPAGAPGFDVAIDDPQGCGRYIAQAIENVTIGAAPAWLRGRLESVGQRPINAVVDLTNFILFELAQPLHAFDLDTLRGPAIRVRRAKPGETLTTLDGKPRTLGPEILVIADQDRPVALAGVMGGAETEVGEATRRILLECAWFDPRRVRRGARALGLSTEASKRFERGVDPQIGPVAVARFLELLAECAPGHTVGPSADARVPAPARPPVALRSSRLERLVGMAVPPADARRELEALEFAVSGQDPLAVGVPSWRPDVTIEDDLVEEVARAVGYDRIPEAPLETAGVHAVRTARERRDAHAREAMRARGISEAWTTTLVAAAEAESCARLLGADPALLVALQNPLSRESEVLRPNPVPGLMRACAHNLRQGVRAVRLFEIGNGFLWREGAARERELPREMPMLAALVTGPVVAHAHDPAPRDVDFWDAKGLWEAWLEEMSVDTPEWRTYSADGWKVGASSEVARSTSSIGWAGSLSAAFTRQWEIEAPVHLFVALLDPLEQSRRTPGSATLPGRFPPVRRDVAFFVPEGTTHGELERTLRGAGGDRLDAIELFDVYTGPGTPQGMRSMAFALRFQDPERTLTEAEVQSIQDRMVAAVAERCGGRLRER